MFSKDGQTPFVLWFTGLSGSGKSTVAKGVLKALTDVGKQAYLLDADVVRKSLNKDLGFSNTDREENIRRVGELAKILVDAGLIVLVAFISPFALGRRRSAELFKEGQFIEIYMDTPLSVCESRDVKGLYARARKGELPNFTGVDSPYEIPKKSAISLHTQYETPADSIGRILNLLKI
mgnify:FL=1|jgi:bifunctional enzyme CysN/CysC